MIFLENLFDNIEELLEQNHHNVAEIKKCHFLYLYQINNNLTVKILLTMHLTKSIKINMHDCLYVHVTMTTHANNFAQNG